MSTMSGEESEFSQSTSRRRRPGAAKSRLQAEKCKSSQQTGWRESMQAASMHADRVWEPMNGWVDYKDRQEELQTFQEVANPAGFPSPEGKIRIPLHIAGKNGKEHRNDTGRPLKSSSATAKVALGSSKPKTLNDQQTTKGTKAASKVTRQSLVHTKPKTQHKTLRGNHVSADDACWPQPHSPRRSSESAIPLLPHQKAWRIDRERDYSGCGSPTRRRNLDESNGFNANRATSSPTGKAKSSTWPENPPIPPPVDRIMQQPPTVESIIRSTSLSPTRRRKNSARWVETMRRATAILAREGHIWDPKNGFANLDSADVISLQPSIRSSPPGTESHAHIRQPQPTSVNRNLPADVLERMIAERRKNDPPGRKGSVHASQRASAAKIHGYNESNMRADVGCGDDNRSSIQEQIEVVMLSSTGIGGKDPKYGVSALNFEKEEDYILPAPVVVNPNVTVKKEKVGREEVSLFPKTESPETVLKPLEGTRMIKSRSGRRVGPLDVDTVENLSAVSSTNTETSANVWESGNFENDSFLQGSITPSNQARHMKTQGHRQKPLAPQNQGPVNRDEKELEKGVFASNESGYSNFHELVAQGVLNQTAATKGARVFGVSLVNTKSRQIAFSGKNDEKPGILRTSSRPLPSEDATDDSSIRSSPSSITAWKSFLNQKVKKESAAAAGLQQRVGGDFDLSNEATGSTKEERIKKTVSFASDSILSESLLDSLFDFSVISQDVSMASKPHPSSRNISPPPARNGLWVESRARLASPRYHEGMRLDKDSQYRFNLSEEEKEPIDVAQNLPPHGIQNRSFGTEVSPLTEYPHNEEKESVDAAPSFLSRLVECRQPQIGPPPPGRGRSKDIIDQEAPRAYQWYLQSQQASQKVEEMMEFLKSKRISSCSSIRRESATGSNADVNVLDLPPNTSVPKEVEDSARELAKAKTEAMVETLYYAS